ncbi:MAG: hypothetical protein OXF98_01840 [Rhodospirillaceae bacterium]|nr:hypothetical protein [Rhodospirillaceae bacterium]
MSDGRLRKWKRAPVPAGTQLEPGQVLYEPHTVYFRCPCNGREICVSSPPHGISFSEDGLLSLKGSVGYRARGDRPENWCHFDVSDGVMSMYGDALCPGNVEAS